jgi:hypothetical protein
VGSDGPVGEEEPFADCLLVRPLAASMAISCSWEVSGRLPDTVGEAIDAALTTRCAVVTARDPARMTDLGGIGGLLRY